MLSRVSLCGNDAVYIPETGHTSRKARVAMFLSPFYHSHNAVSSAITWRKMEKLQVATIRV